MSKYVEEYRDLDVYQRAFELQQEIFEATKSFPKNEMFSLTDQIRRSSRSVGANIAEAWRKRKYIAHFKSKLTDSDSEQAETQHWLDSSLACEYITDIEHEKLINHCKDVGRMLGAMMKNAELWCK